MSVEGLLAGQSYLSVICKVNPRGSWLPIRSVEGVLVMDKATCLVCRGNPLGTRLPVRSVEGVLEGQGYCLVETTCLVCIRIP